MATLRLDAAAVHAKVREAGTGTLELEGRQPPESSRPSVSLSSALDLAEALGAEGAGLVGLAAEGIELGADGWRAVAVELGQRASCPQLTTLTLHGCGLGSSGGAAFAAALRQGACTRLTALSVPSNGLDDASFAAIAKALAVSCLAVEVLHVACNALTELPETLFGVASLQQLWLGHNDIGALPRGLLGLARLRRLNVEGNPRLTTALDLPCTCAKCAQLVGDPPRRRSVLQIVGGTYDAERKLHRDNDVEALFEHLRLVRG